MSTRRIVVASLAILSASAFLAGASGATPGNVGQSIYLHGVTGSGAPLEGAREERGISTQGAEAACVNCHQRSGLGSAEGSVVIPPVTGDYLFHGHAHGGDTPVLPYVESMHGNREPYTTTSLARAIREGVDSDGRLLSHLMPRFALDDADMAALIEYLKKLSVHHAPGIADGILNLATIFTPDSDPVKRAGVLEVLEHFVKEKNSFPIAPSPRMWTSGKTAYAKSMYMANLRWHLHVWQLTGPDTTWREQLERHLREDPVFALLSGLGGSNWAPVHEFCERNEIPCLFPNVEVPVETGDDFYSLYFSKGVLLEAELIAKQFAALQKKDTAVVVEQIYRSGDSGDPAARALAAELEQQGVTVHNHALAPGGAGHGLNSALRANGKEQVLVLWLRPADIAALGPPPPPGTRVYISGLMGGLEDMPLPTAWRSRSLLAYPFDVPDRRGVRLDYALGWFSFRHIPVVAPQVQADTYLACSLLSEVIKQLADSYVRPYLIEQLQGMMEHRLMTGYYPHLALTYHQRFASKGGYIARFSANEGRRLIADGGWIVP